MSSIITKIRKELEQNVDEKTKNSASRFFKEEVKFYGVKTATVRKIATEHFKSISGKSKSDIFSLCEELLRSDYSEEAFIAFEWSYRLRDQYEPEDIEVFERWIGNYVNNWAKCDFLCNYSVGSFIEMYPQYIGSLKTWAGSDNRWFRRAAAVTLVLPARRGDYLEPVLEIADLLLTDKDDLVRKGYGWMLKEASKSHQQEIFNYVMENKKIMPRTALRYAIEKMPTDLKSKAMEK